MSARDRHKNYVSFGSYNGEAPNHSVSASDRFASPPPPSPQAPPSYPSQPHPAQQMPAQPHPAQPHPAQPQQRPQMQMPEQGSQGSSRVFKVSCDQAYAFLADRARHHVRDEAGNVIKPVRVFLKISTEWCGPCKKVKPFLDQISVHPGHEDILFLCVDGDELMQHTALSKLLPVSAVPSFFGFVAGEKKGFMTGIKEDEILQFLQKLLKQ